MEKRHLEYIVAVADYGGFTAAAASLHVTQSALSQSVAQAERELGVRLFFRVAHQVRPTPAGEAVLGPARQVLRGFSSIGVAAVDASGLSGGILELATLPTLAQWPATPLVAEFRRRYPGIRVHLRGPARSRTAELAEMVHRGVCEVGLTERGAATEGLIETHLKTHDYVVLLPPGYREPARGPVSMEDVLSLGLIVGPWWETSRPYLAFREAYPDLVDKAVTVRIDHREAYVPLVLAGAGAAFLPRFVAESATSAGAIIGELDIVITRELVMIRRADPLTPVAQALEEVVIELLSPPHPYAHA